MWYDTAKYLLTVPERQSYGRAAILSLDECSFVLFLNIISQDTKLSLFYFRGDF